MASRGESVAARWGRCGRCDCKECVGGRSAVGEAVPSSTFAALAGVGRSCRAAGRGGRAAGRGGGGPDTTEPVDGKAVRNVDVGEMDRFEELAPVEAELKDEDVRAGGTIGSC